MWLLSFAQKSVLGFALDPSSNPIGDTESPSLEPAPSCHLESSTWLSHLGSTLSSPTHAFQFSEDLEPSRHNTTTLWDSKVRTAQSSYFQTNKNHETWVVIVVDLIYCWGAFLMYQLINYTVTVSYHSLWCSDGHEVALLWEDLKTSKAMQASLAGGASAGQLSSLLFLWTHHRQVKVDN